LVLLGMAMNVAGLVIMAFGEVLIVLLAGRLISGLGIGMTVPAVRRIVVVADPDNVGNNMGTLLAADVAGFATGPVISALLVPEFGIPAPFLTIAGLTILCFPIALRVRIDESAIDTGRRSQLAFDLLRIRGIVAGVMMGAALYLMIGTFDALWAIVLDDLDATEFVANVGITIFALPLVFLGPFGGRLAQRVGPFRLGPLGLVLGAVFMFLYGVMPTAYAMLAVGVVHALFDGVTASSTGVAVAMTAPRERQAAAQGLVGAAETLSGGATAVLAGVLYDVGGRTLAYTTCSVIMIALAVGAYLLAGEHRARRPKTPVAAPTEPAVTGHA
jgi:MFS family permease